MAIKGLVYCEMLDFLKSALKSTDLNETHIEKMIEERIAIILSLFVPDREDRYPFVGKEYRFCFDLMRV